jgi:hypothetical protein
MVISLDILRLLMELLLLLLLFGFSRN